MRLQLDSSALRPQDSLPVQSPTTGAATVPGTDRPGSLDSVGVSGISVAIGQLAAERTARIVQLASAVRNGTYNVASGPVGRAILNQAAN